MSRAILAIVAALAIGSVQGRDVAIVSVASVGSPPDVQVRTLAAALSAALDARVKIENYPGAGGAIGIQEALRREDDCSTLLSFTSFNIAALDASEEDFDFEASFAMIGSFLSEASILSVRADAPWVDTAALLTASRDRPISVATANVRSPQGFAFEALRASGYQLHIVPMPVADSQANLLGGFVDAAFMTPASTSALGDAIRPLAALTPPDAAARAGVESLAAVAGIALPDGSQRRALAARRGCAERDPETFAALQRAFAAAETNPDFLEAATTIGFVASLEFRDAAAALEEHRSILGWVTAEPPLGD